MFKVNYSYWFFNDFHYLKQVGKLTASIHFEHFSFAQQILFFKWSVNFALLAHVFAVEKRIASGTLETPDMPLLFQCDQRLAIHDFFVTTRAF